MTDSAGKTPVFTSYYQARTLMRKSPARDKMSICGMLVACLALANVTVNAETYYVRTSGNDSNPGTSAGKALRTINKAATKAKAGDKVHVGAGTYSGSVHFANDGTSANPIEFIADTSGSQTGDAGTVTVTTSSGSVFNIDRDNYITLAGFVISGGRDGVYVNRSTGAVITNCTIQSAGDDGIDLNSSSAIIEKCIVKNTGDKGVDVSSGSFSIVSCLIVNSGSDGIITNSLAASSKIWHTTIHGAGNDGIDHGGGTLNVFNSIIANCNDDGLDRQGGVLNHDYNIVFSNDRGNFDGTSKNTHELTIDPKFVSATDFHLQASSPGIGAGTYLGVSEDLDGNPIPAGSASIGAYYVPGGGGGGSGSEYFVRMSGNDSNHGKSKTMAFRTLSKAASVVAPGNTVWVGAGVYVDAPNLDSKLGTEALPIQFNADIDGAKTGDAGTVTVQGGFYLLNSSYVTIKQFTFQAGGQKAAWSSYYTTAHLFGCSNILLDQLTSAGGNYGFLAENSTSINATSCVAAGASVHGFCFQGTTTGTITACQANSNGHTGIYVAQGAVELNGCTTSANAAYGIRYNGARGTLNGCNSTGDYLGAALLGVNNDRTSIVANNLTIQSSQNGGAVLQVCTAQLLAGAQPLSNGGAYGVYVDNATLSFNNGVIRNTLYGVQVFNGGEATLSNCAISDCANDGISTAASSATLTGCILTKCLNGIIGTSNSSITATSCTVTDNRGWGISLSGQGAVDGCTVANNYQGVSLTGQTTRGDVTINNTTIDNSTREGLVAIRSTGNAAGAANKLSNAGNYGVYLEDSDLVLSNLQIQGPDYGISAYGSTLALNNGSISDTPSDGIYLSNCQTALAGCTISTCRYGVRSENGGTLTVDDSLLTGNSAWAILHTGLGSIADCVVTDNYQGLNLVGASATGDITLSNTVIDNTTREGFAVYRCTGDLQGGAGQLSQGGSYGGYLSESTLTLSNVEITAADYGIKSESSTLNLSGATITDCTYDGIYSNQATTTLSNCTIARCRNGVFGENASTLMAASNTIDACTAWGISHAGYGTIADCVVNNCNQGMYLIGASQPTDIQVTNGVIQGTAQDGLVAIRASGDLVGGADKLSNGGAYGVYLSQANFTLVGVSVTGSQYGMVSLNSTLNAPNATISGTAQSGVYAETSTVTLTNANVLGCGASGVDCQVDSTLTASSCTISSCGDWGLKVSGFGTLTACQLQNNTYGASLTGKAARGDITLTDLTISGCADQGLVAVRCEGTVSGGSSPLSSGGDWGIFSDDSELVVTDALISGPSTGVQSAFSNLTLRDVRISDATNGVDSDNDESVVLERTRLENCSAWGLRQSQGRTQLTNCLVINNASGLYYADTLQANLWNTTVTTTGQYGLYQSGGTVDVKNTILVGNSTGIGIYRTGGSLVTSHNLVYGFASGYSGVTPDTNSVTKSPRFADLAGGDFHLAQGSPAINAGSDAVFGQVDADYDGSPRPTYNSWEIGAFEYLSESGSVRVLNWSEKK